MSKNEILPKTQKRNRQENVSELSHEHLQPSQNILRVALLSTRATKKTGIMNYWESHC